MLLPLIETPWLCILSASSHVPQPFHNMATKCSLDEKLDSSADHIDDVETQQERVLSMHENNVGIRERALDDGRTLTSHRHSRSMYSTRRRQNVSSARSTFA